MLLRLLFKLVKTLNSETDPGQISLALCFALLAGLPPFLSLHNILVLLLVLVLRVNISMFIFGTVFFSGVAYLADPILSRIGYAVLTTPSLEGLWTSLYNNSFMRVENFNNSIVMGALVVAFVSFIPGYFIFNMLIRKYRDHVLAWVKKLKIIRALQGNKLYEIYSSIRGWV
jgi:uncharacterized protein (TIGR03546 family)